MRIPCKKIFGDDNRQKKEEKILKKGLLDVSTIALTLILFFINSKAN